jgi:hypothetical protein
LFSSHLFIVRRVTIFLISPQCPFFETTRYFTSLPRSLVQIYIRILFFARTSFDLKEVTPCSVAEGHRAKFETSTDVQVTTQRNLCHCPSVNCSRC